MRYVPIAGLGPCSCLALGTMAYSPDRMEQASSLLDAFLALGGNVIDTAHNYGGERVGRSERAIGRWLQERRCRDRVVILDKGAHPDERGPRVNAREIAADLAESLERLQVERIDLYMLHRDDPAVPVGPIIEACNEHVRAGRVVALGASNWSHQRIDEANAFAAAHGMAGFVASSTNLALARAQEARWAGCVSLDEEGRAWHRARQFPLLSWSAQAAGFFTGRYRPDGPAEPDIVRVYYAPDNWERLRRATALATELGVTATQVALAYVLHQSFPTCAIMGPLTLEEFAASAEAERVSLTPAQVRWLNLEGVPA